MALVCTDPSVVAHKISYPFPNRECIKRLYRCAGWRLLISQDESNVGCVVDDALMTHG